MTTVGKTPGHLSENEPAAPSANAMAVLGLLGVAPMTAYGLAEQTQRAFGYLWSVSRSLLLGQPKKLAADGLVEKLAPAPGSRASRRWAASERGRAVFRRWLETDVEPTRVSSEIGLRLVFSDQGDLATLERQLDLRRAQLVETMREGLAFADGYLADGGPFPGRLHILAATLVFIENQVEGELRAIDAVRGIVSTWADTSTAVPERDRAEIRAMRARLAARLSELSA